MNLKKFLLFTIVIFSFHLTIFSQTASIKGFIKEDATGEPIIFTSVYLLGTQFGAVTDVNGYYVISRIPPGSYTLMVTYMGFDTIKNPLELKKGDIILKNLKLIKSNISLKEVDISAQNEKDEAKTETKTAVVKITPKQISQIPSIGGQADLAQYLQVLPGVVFSGDQGGQLYICGGSPIQNEVLLDGMIIYNPFHSIGLFSVFDTDILRNADVYTGGFGAEYGDRISSVMDISTRDGNKKRIAGKASASPFGAKFLIEGPLQREKNAGDGSTSFVFSAKNSYLKESSQFLYPYIDGGLPYNYTDLYGKLSMNGGNGNKINFFGFNFNDNVDYKDISNFKWNSYGGGTNFVLAPASSSVLMQGNFAYSDYKIELDEKNLNPRTSEISGFNGGLNWTYYLGKNEARWGIEMLGFKTVFNYFNSVNLNIDYTTPSTELACFLKYKWTLGKFLIEPSFRLQYYASPLKTMSPEPRLAMKYNISDKVRIKFAGGIYSQDLIAANSDQDVVNLFYGFLSGIDNLPTEFDGKAITSKLQRSDHLILGVEFDPAKHLTANIEGYYKYFPQLTNINNNKIFDDNDANASQPDYLKKDFIIETGDAEGADASLKYEYKHLYIWAVYSLGYIHRFDGIVHYVPTYDRRHNINLVASYSFGKNLDWGVDIRWNLASGFPFTLTQGYYENIPFSGGINSNYTTENGELGTIYADQNGGRLPYYHRLDLTIKRHFMLGQFTSLDANFSIINVYDRANIFYVDRITQERVNQLPIMPSIGLDFSF